MDIPMLIGLDVRTIYTNCRRGIGKNLIDLYTTVAEQRPAWRTRGTTATCRPRARARRSICPA